MGVLWLDVLDRGLDWSAPGGLEVSGREAILRQTALLRRACASRMLQADLDRDDQSRLSQWLEAVTLSFRPGPSSEGEPLGFASAWPILRAHRRRGHLPEPFESVLSTALVQFLSQWNDSLEAAIYRCHGVRRGPSPIRDLPEAWEVEFARRAEILDLLRTGDMHQCPRFVWSDRGSRYCGKACSNASFVIRKQRREPRYFAEKQERYRARQQRQETPRTDRGAFVYID